MREHYRMVLSQSRRMLGVVEDAEDVAQSVFVKAWQAWDGFEGNEYQRRAWLLRITRNATVDAARKRKLRRMAPLDVCLKKGRHKCCPLLILMGTPSWPGFTRRCRPCHQSSVGCFKRGISMTEPTLTSRSRRALQKER